VVDENLGPPDYAGMPEPDLVGITAFTSQAPRAYELASGFRARGVPVVMGGIHASMVSRGAGAVGGRRGHRRSGSRLGAGSRRRPAGHLEAALRGQPRRSEKHSVRAARLAGGKIFLWVGPDRARLSAHCSFCQRERIQRAKYRRRVIEDVVQEFKMIQEEYVLVVDDNLIGTREDHIAGAKELLRA